MDNFVSKHFTLEQVRDGIFAAIAKEGGGAVGNAGFIDLGDQTIIFDTFNTQQAAEDLKSFAETITQKPITWVVNSHWHGDHIRGNQVFEESTIVSSQITFEKMKEAHPERIKKQQGDIAGLENYITSLKEKMQGGENEKLANQISFLKEMKQSLPTLRLVLPKVTFENELTIHGSKRTAKLFTLGGGHSDCDTILYVPEEQTIFMGDLLFVGTHPTFFPESNPNEWISILHKLEDMEITQAVPGHGQIGAKEDIVKVINYISDLLQLSKVDTDGENIVMPADYEAWSSPEVFHGNLKMLRGR